MSSANLDLVRSIYADWERGDFRSDEWADPAIEFVFVDGPAPGSWTGVARMAESVRDALSAWDDWRPEVEEYRELDAERVLVLIQRKGRGKRSGLEIGQLGTKGAHLFHVRYDKVARFVAYWDRDRALADLGLTPDTGTDPYFGQSCRPQRLPVIEVAACAANLAAAKIEDHPNRRVNRHAAASPASFLPT